MSFRVLNLGVNLDILSLLGCLQSNMCMRNISCKGPLTRKHAFGPIYVSLWGWYGLVKLLWIKNKAKAMQGNIDAREATRKQKFVRYSLSFRVICYLCVMCWWYIVCAKVRCIVRCPCFLCLVSNILKEPYLFRC